MRKLLIAFGIICTAGLAACESLDKRGYSRQEQGTVGGAAAGGVIGNAATGGSTLGTVGGAAVGGVIGNQAGQAYDERKEREGK
jgi:osmotically inducible lipoprotein OsmB